MNTASSAVVTGTRLLWRPPHLACGFAHADIDAFDDLGDNRVIWLAWSS